MCTFVFSAAILSRKMFNLHPQNHSSPLFFILLIFLDFNCMSIVLMWICEFSWMNNLPLRTTSYQNWPLVDWEVKEFLAARLWDFLMLIHIRKLCFNFNNDSILLKEKDIFKIRTFNNCACPSFHSLTWLLCSANT